MEQQPDSRTDETMDKVYRQHKYQMKQERLRAEAATVQRNMVRTCAWYIRHWMCTRLTQHPHYIR